MKSSRSRGLLSICLILILILWPLAGFAADIAGQRLPGASAQQETTAEIMARQAVAPPAKTRPYRELESPDRSQLPQNPDAPAISQFPSMDLDQSLAPSPSIQTTALAFDGPTLSDTGAFPPDSMGAVGPTQFITFVNGRLRTFAKSGSADGVLNADPDVFFASVTTPVSPPVVLTFTSDPQIRYDRNTGRWFLLIIDVPCTNGGCTATAANRVMIAVSDSASNGTISNSTVWSFFYFVGSAGTDFLDYPALGVDVNALYVGGNMFSSAGSFVGTNGYVVQKSSILGAGPIITTVFANLAAGSGAGPYTPRGVDNFDSGATEGYFIGVDNATFSTLMFRRVSNPGSATPTISGNISLTVPTTTYPNSVEHAGNTGGNNGKLDALDDRLFEAMIRNGRLWTAHNFRVSTTGVANTAALSRNASRWYEIQSLSTTPTLVQSGTVFDNVATRAAAQQYFIPSIAVTGQGHAVIGFTGAGVIGATPAYTGRLASDPLGSMNGSPGTGVTTFGTSTSNYNPPSDPGGSGGRRWGDYSFTSVDPLDDMTVWTIQEYNQATNSYAVRVGKLLAPPPATPTCTGAPIAFNGPTGNVVIGATSVAGSGFYDPGANLPSPALPFSHLSATVTNATVNSATFNSPTQVTLNITANAIGLQNVVLTNPDGQSVSATGCIDVQSIALSADLSITKSDGVTTAIPGDSVTYTITVANAGPSNVNGATVVDAFPVSETCTWTCVGSVGSNCTATGLGSIFDSVDLTSGGNVTYTASCAISAAASGTLSNTATVAVPGGVTDPTPGNNSATDSDTLSASADLSITKTDGVTTATPGGTLTYTITAANAGPSDVLGATVADTFPTSLGCTWTCVGAGGGTCMNSGTGNINGLANLPSGGSATYTANCVISAAATGTLSNTATVAAPGGATDPTPGNNSATDTDTLTATADLSITKTDGVTSATPGGTLIYTITAANAGPSNVLGATVADTFPTSLGCTWTCVGAGGGTCMSSGTGNLNGLANLPSGGSATYIANCVISAAATGTLSNTATVAAPGGVTDPTPGNNSATDSDTLSASADLSITKTDGVTTATPGGSVTYTIAASNAGPSNATGATVADTFPASLTCNWTCAGSGGGTCAASGSGNINGSVNLPSGGNVTYTASCAISSAASGTLSNTATVAAPGGVTDPTPGNNSATDTDTLANSADLAVAITDNRIYVQVGDSLDYLIEVSNPSGPSPAVASVSDVLPVVLNGGSWICSATGGASCGSPGGSGNSLADTTTVPVGGKTSYLFSATVQTFDPTDRIVNTATATLTNGSDPTPANNTATDTDIVVIFRNGFDPGSNSVALIIGTGSDYVSAQLGVDADLLATLGIVPVSIASGQGADGKTLFVLQLARFGDEFALRILDRNASDDAERSNWQAVDMAEKLIDFAWQSASTDANDGYVSVLSGQLPLTVSGRSEQGRLTQLQVTVQNSVPWLVRIAH